MSLTRYIIFRIVKFLERIGKKFWDILMWLSRVIDHIYFQYLLYFGGVFAVGFLLYALYIGLT